MKGFRLARGAATLILAAAVPARGQVRASSPTPFTVDVGVFHQSLDNGYGDWNGADVRLSYTSPRLSPFIGISTQHRDGGDQQNVGVGSYITLDSHSYAIVGVSRAPGGSAVFYPKLRWDASVFMDTRVVPGLMVGVGYTQLSFGGGSTGSIMSAGPVYYHGPLILSGSLRLNHDGVGGANTASGEVGGQYGAQGKQWVGASVGAGREAYEILAATPLDVHFTDIGGSAFYQRWLTAHTAAMLRLDYEHKLTAYQRRGITLSYRVEF